jgi:hypothetical protein
MRFTASALGLALIIASALPAWAQDKYGDAVLEKGTLTVVRGGQNLKFNKANESVPVFIDDLLRVGEDSRVSLKTREKSTINMGANAVFQVKPFQFQEKQGFARMLFGRFRSVVSGLSGGESVNAKTATAVIGVKGTENLASIRPRGDTMLIGVKDTTEVRGAARGGKRVADSGRMAGHPQAELVADRGEDPEFMLIPSSASDVRARRVQDGGNTVPVDPNMLTLVLGDNPPTPPAPVPPEVLQEFQGDNLNSPSPESGEAGNFPGQDGLVKAGITNQGDLDEGESGDVEGGGGGGAPQGGGGGGGQSGNPDVGTPDLSEGQQNLFRGNVTPSFKQK